jgi:PAP2 superfamily
MKAFRFLLAIVALVAAMGLSALSATAAEPGVPPPVEVLRDWYKLALALVRHTPTYSPPVAARTLAYLGVAAFEATASGDAELQTLAGQLNGLKPTPSRAAGETYDDAVVLDATLSAIVGNLFSNTGPTGQRAMTALADKLHAEVSAAAPPDVAARSEAYGRVVAEHVLAWSRDDGGAVVENMGFPLEYALTKGAAHWTPTSLIAQQQAPLLPDWGKNRTLVMPNGAACPLPPPLEYSEDKSSEFYKQALEVYQTRQTLTQEQRDIARFWSDDAMLTVTPPGHWISIALQVLAQENAGLARSVDALARVGLAVSDAFVGCWNTKFQYDLVRPVTYIHRVIDPKWEPLLITPPFPEYPSGHSTQTGAAAVVMTQLFGENFAFQDMTDRSDGLPPRNFPSFWAAAEEAAISRMYGGIHFRAAIERGLDQGRCVGQYVNALRTRR